jgi:hypothetical protein
VPLVGLSHSSSAEHSKEGRERMAPAGWAGSSRNKNPDRKGAAEVLRRDGVQGTWFYFLPLHFQKGSHLAKPQFFHL